MNKALFLKRITFFCFLLMSLSLYSQSVNTEGEINKIIIDGKSYYLHVVKTGEGFFRIATSYGVSQKEIHDANPNALFGLKPGDILYIPVISGRNSSAGEIQESNDFIYHTIQKGQTLYFLSKKYNVSIDEIKKVNIGANENLIVGSMFKIPVHQEQVSKDVKEPKYTYHEVERKETLYGISRKYNVGVKDIIKYNPALQNGILAVGSKVRIPQVHAKQVLNVDQNSSNTIIEDEKFLYHKVVIGDTFYSLSNKYHVSKDVIILSNPDLNPDDLALGYMIRIAKNAVDEHNLNGQLESDFFEHIVKRKETLYTISRTYQISIEDIENANPTRMLNNIKKGDRLQIPTLIYLTRIQNEAAREESLTIRHNESDLVDSAYVDCDSYHYSDLNETIYIAMMLPFNIEATKKANIVSKMVNGKEIKVQRNRAILSSQSKPFVEFYEGALMAINSLKKQGVNIHLFTYDTAPDTNKVKQILEQPELQRVDFIIGPAYTSNLSLVSDFSYKHGIKLIYPLSNKGDELNNNPYLFQVNAPDALLYEKYADHITNQHVDTRIIVLKSSEPDVEEEKLCSTIKDKLFLKYIPQGMVPNYLEINFSEQDVQGIEALLDNEHENVVVIPSPQEADVSKIIATLHGVVESSNIKVKLIGFQSWLNYQTINAEEIHDLNTEIFTSYALDYKQETTTQFIHEYRRMFYTEPFAVSPYFVRPARNSKYSKYGIWGYDVARYFIGARVEYGKKFDCCISEFNQQQVQFNFQFKRTENWGGFYNQGLHVIQFSPSLEINRITL